MTNIADECIKNIDDVVSEKIRQERERFLKDQRLREACIQRLQKMPISELFQVFNHLKNTGLWDFRKDISDCWGEHGEEFKFAGTDKTETFTSLMYCVSHECWEIFSDSTIRFHYFSGENIETDLHKLPAKSFDKVLNNLEAFMGAFFENVKSLRPESLLRPSWEDPRVCGDSQNG